MGVEVASLVAVATAQVDSRCLVAVDIEVAIAVDTACLVVVAAASFHHLDSLVVVA